MKKLVIRSTYPNWVAATLVGIALFFAAICLASSTGCGHVEKIVENTQTVVSTAYSVISPERVDTIPLVVTDQNGSELKFSVWLEGDSLQTNLPPQYAMWGSRWWKCLSKAMLACRSKSGTGEDSPYGRCIASSIAGCTIGDAILSVTCDLFPDKK
jgi:hypothetical protein